MNVILVLLIGLVAGLSGRLRGIGVAVVIIPALVLAQKTTLSMLVTPVSSSAARYYYSNNGYVDVKAAIALSNCVVIGGLCILLLDWMHIRKLPYNFKAR